MKMSRSINDYRDAMDNIKISDSFYKRTEVLLNESSEMEAVRGSRLRIKLLTRSAVVVAACVMAAFGIKTVIDSRESETAVVTEAIEAQITTVVTVPETVPETASPVIDRPDGDEFLNDSGVFVGDMPEIPEYEDVKDMEDEEVGVAPTAAEAETEELGPSFSTATEREGYPEMAEPQGSEDIPPINETATETVNVKITPYFDLGAIKSGENPVSGSGKDYGELISAISSSTLASPITENESFVSLFLVQISERGTELPYYSIYVTDASTLVVTRHDIDDQKRTTYQLADGDYDAVLRQLYVMFGNVNEYSYFRNSETNT